MGWALHGDKDTQISFRHLLVYIIAAHLTGVDTLFQLFFV
jgi:hypothetical protein